MQNPHWITTAPSNFTTEGTLNYTVENLQAGLSNVSILKPHILSAALKDDIKVLYFIDFLSCSNSVDLLVALIEDLTKLLQMDLIKYDMLDRPDCILFCFFMIVNTYFECKN